MECCGLSQEEKKRYKQEHAHIAPDLCDGPVSQSFLTDIYSFGRIIRKVNGLVIRSNSLAELVKQAMAYHSNVRPTLADIAATLEGSRI